VGKHPLDLKEKKDTMYTVNITFVELKDFLDDVSDDDEDFRELQNELLENPAKGDVIENCGGLRKIRMKLPGRGKSSSARVIYLHLPKYEKIILFYAFTKARSENISAKGKKILRDQVALIKRHYENTP